MCFGILTQTGCRCAEIAVTMKIELLYILEEMRGDERPEIKRNVRERLAPFYSVKAISMARVAIQPRASESDWRAKAKPILKPKDLKKKESK